MRRGGGEHVGDALGLIGIGRGIGRGEPALDRRIAQADHRGFAIAQDHFDARVPGVRRADLGGGVADDQAVQAFTCIDPQPLTDQAAHGQATEVRTLDLQGIEQRQHVLAQLLDAVRPLGYQRSAMATGVVAQHAKVRSEGRHLGVPHVQVGAQGVGQHQHRRAFRAVELIIECAIGELYLCHCSLLQALKR
ncbi:hypothetical protein D3C80_1443760 [compost metagenome]